MADMRIALIGQQAFGKAVLEALLERGEDVIAVYCAPDKEGARPDPLKEAALEHKLPLLQPASFKEPEVWQAFADMSPDLGVMAFVTLFVPEDFLHIPTKGTIQYHPSLLPRHRGPSSINWPIIQGAEKTGLSIFWPDNGLDEGPILLQKEVEIAENDTLGSIYFDKLFPLGVEAMLESIDLVRAGNAPKIDAPIPRPAPGPPSAVPRCNCSSLKRLARPAARPARSSRPAATASSSPAMAVRFAWRARGRMVARRSRPVSMPPKVASTLEPSAAETPPTADQPRPPPPPRQPTRTRRRAAVSRGRA